MVNLLRFHDHAQYANDSGAEPCSGQEAYLTRYLPAFTVAVQPHGGSELVFAAMVIARVVGPVEKSWDAIGVARYPGIPGFPEPGRRRRLPHQRRAPPRGRAR